MKTHDKLIMSDPNVMMGKPIISGTRITVELILEKLAAGEKIEQITEAHPRLTPQAIQAALSFAAEALKASVFLEPYRTLIGRDDKKGVAIATPFLCCKF